MRFTPGIVYAWATLAPCVVIMVGLIIGSEACGKLPRAITEVGVHSEDFSAPTASAMNIINRFAGCKILVEGDDVDIRSDDGTPCGDPWRPSAEEGHSATSYRCGNRWEVLVSSPGDVHTQTCIAAHEIGHALGLKDSTGRGIMNQYKCPTPIILSDAESFMLKERYCER